MKEARYLFPQDYMADPSAHVFNGKVYIYPSHDWDSGTSDNDNGDQYNMKDYHCLSIEDLENDTCKDEGVILRLEDVPWAKKQLWDSDVVEKDGKYYLCFCAKDWNEVFHLGIAVADKPEGPFVAEPDPIRGSYSIDPCLFKDDDGSIYVYFGGIWGGQLQRYRDNVALEVPHLPNFDEPALCPRIAKMSDDMLQFAEEPKAVVIYDEEGELKHCNKHRFFEASWMVKKDGKYLFIYSTGDSHLLCYAEGDNPYGPFKYKGELLQPVVGWTTHSCVTEYKGKWYLFHHDCVPSNGVSALRSLKVKEIEL